MSNEYDYHTLEVKADTGRVVLYGWGTYARHSVLAGQQKKCFIRSYETQEQAQEENPDAKWSNSWTEREISLNHLD